MALGLLNNPRELDSQDHMALCGLQERARCLFHQEIGTERGTQVPNPTS